MLGHDERVLILREVPRSRVRVSAGLAALETTVALGIAHTAAGGQLPSAGWLLAIAATTYGASLPVLRGRAPVRVVLPATVGLQVVLHAWLVALTTGSGLHSHGDGGAALLGLSWPMLLAHLAAGAVAAAAWIVRRRAVDVLLGRSEPATATTAHRPRVTTRRAWCAPVGRDVTVLPTRGPPVGLLATA